MNTRGFTLIELLVVIAIIGILSSVVLASLNSAREGARDSRRQSDMSQIRTAMELYANEFGNYNATIPGDIEPYMQSIPVDPSDATDYTVTTSDSGYCISAPLFEGDMPDNDTDCDATNYSIGPGV